jgi:hypothetical protein
MSQQKICFFIFAFLISLDGNSQNSETNDTVIYKLKAKLVNARPNPPGCGVIAWANAQKFEVIESNYPLPKGSKIIIIQPCPEFLGIDFFKNKKNYLITFGKHNNAPFGYTIINEFEKEKLPTVWCREIILAE